MSGYKSWNNGNSNKSTVVVVNHQMVVRGTVINQWNETPTLSTEKSVQSVA